MIKKTARMFAMAAALAASGLALAAETITVGIVSDPAYEAALWALQNGKVKDPAVEVKVTSLTIPALIQAGMTRQFNVLPNGIVAVAQLAEQGVPVRIVGTIIRYHPEGHPTDIWVNNNSPYKTIQDLKGKSIGVTSLEAQNVISIRAVISERHKMNASAVGGDFRWVELPASQVEAALQSGKIDAANISNVRSYTVFASNAYRSVLQGSKGLLEMYGGPMPSVVNTAYLDDLEKRPEAYVAFLKLAKASAAYAIAHPDEVFGAVAPKFNIKPEDLKAYFTTFSVMPYALGPTDKAVFMKSWESAKKLGIINKVPANAESLVWPKAVTE